MNAQTELGPDALDFWIGDWSVSWPGGTGTNRIRRILQDRVIEEVFECHGADGSLYGRSHSVLDAADGAWRQTWVDSSGAYLDFVGVVVDGRISFQRTDRGDPNVLQRMVWLDVRDDGFRWEWQRSTDRGATWEVSWPLTYRRRSAGESDRGQAGTLVGSSGPGMGSTGAAGNVSGVSGESSPGSSGTGSSGSIGG